MKEKIGIILLKILFVMTKNIVVRVNGECAFGFDQVATKIKVYEPVENFVCIDITSEEVLYV